METATISFPSVELERVARPFAERVQDDHMSWLGIRNSMRISHAYNLARLKREDDQRRMLYEEQLATLLDENGAPNREAIEINDGWALDTTMSLPHLQRVLEDSDKIIAERSGARTSTPGTYRSYFQDMWTPADAARYPSFLNFATSSEMLATVAHYMKCIPLLSTALPRGIRFVESNTAFDDCPETPHDSQLFHIDHYSYPNLYVLVLLRDTTFEHGPWSFLPREVSQEASKALNYWDHGRPYRLSDEEIYSVVDRSELIEFCAPRGTVLFIESSGCFHYGSRNSVKPRFQLMLGYTPICRTDFSDMVLPPMVFPVQQTDSRIRKFALDKTWME
jgi:hypothetical protein